MELTLSFRIYLCILAFLFGTVFGSFLNCMAWRIAHNESVLKGRSHCAVCGHTLGIADLIPVFSWLFLGGRCRYCKEKISPRYVAAELVCGCGFVLSFLRYGVSWRTLQVIVLFCILLALSLTDFEIYEIPDRFILAGIIWALLMMKPQIGVLFAIPILMKRRFITAGVAVAAGVRISTCSSSQGFVTPSR